MHRYIHSSAAFTADLIEVRRGRPLVLLGGQYDESRWGISRCVFLFHVGHGTWMLLQKCWQNKFVFKLLLDPFNLSVIHADSLMSRCQRCVFVDAFGRSLSS